MNDAVGVVLLALGVGLAVAWLAYVTVGMIRDWRADRRRDRLDEMWARLLDRGRDRQNGSCDDD